MNLERTETEGSNQWGILSTTKKHKLSLTRLQAIDTVKLLSNKLWGKEDGSK